MRRTLAIEMKESQKIEFKLSWRDEYLKHLCAYANSQGGSLFIGISDDGNITGVKDSKKLLEGRRGEFIAYESPIVCPLMGTLDVSFYGSIPISLLFPELELA